MKYIQKVLHAARRTEVLANDLPEQLTVAVLQKGGKSSLAHCDPVNF